MADIDLLVIEKHAVDSLDGTICGFSSLVVDEAVTLGAAMLVRGNFAGEDIAEGSKGIMERLVVMSSSRFLMKMLP